VRGQLIYVHKVTALFVVGSKSNQRNGHVDALVSLLQAYLAIFIPSKQITHVHLSALDLSGFVYIQMLNLYNFYMFRSTNRPSSGFSQYLLLESLHYFQRKIVCYI
jgi:hypothetical protein